MRSVTLVWMADPSAEGTAEGRSADRSRWTPTGLPSLAMPTSMSNQRLLSLASYAWRNAPTPSSSTRTRGSSGASAFARYSPMVPASTEE
jgi:hypothetical protein